MKHIKYLVALGSIVLLVMLPLITAPAYAASADCVALNGYSANGGGLTFTDGVAGTFGPGDLVTVTVTLLQGGGGSFRIVGDPGGVVTLAGPASVPGVLQYMVTGPLPAGSIGIGFYVSGVDGTVNVSVTCSGESTGVECLIGDGRVNNRDCGAPVAVYEGSIDVYGIDPATGNGSLDIRIGDEAIDEVGVPTTDTLLAEGTNGFTGQPIQVWRLASGEFLLNTYYADGKAYIITWEEGGTNLIHIAY